MTEVAQRTGLTRAGARRILLTLEGLGYVESQGPAVQFTPNILDLGFAYLSSLPLWNLAEPVMEALVAEVKESCSAAVLDGAGHRLRAARADAQDHEHQSRHRQPAAGVLHVDGPHAAVRRLPRR